MPEMGKMGKGGGGDWVDGCKKWKVKVVEGDG